MSEDCIRLEFDVDSENFASAGMASEAVKTKLKQLGINMQDVRRVAIAMYEGEINMVIHAKGGKATVDIFPHRVDMILADKGPGIADIDLAMKEGYSTAPDNIRALGFGAGMGLPNMKKNTDAMKIDSVQGIGTTIYMTVNLH
ncbi:MAG: anti-sigma regulatory factor [Clostridiales bacterium]|jgi:anti-sigma regulatory factor (Ser/Thr protein kinase)|nr:anti-sigma regulatory factor [Clostridiales bacterium]